MELSMLISMFYGEWFILLKFVEERLYCI